MADPLCLITPSRLHFGLLARAAGRSRQFGGLGLMVDDPGLVVSTGPSPSWEFRGPLAERAERVTGQLVGRLADQGIPVPACRISIDRAPPEHVGLGTGTQLSLALARIVTTLVGRPDSTIEELVRLTGRGQRSGVGLHGFVHGGLIVDGGRPANRPSSMPPLLARLTLDESWHVLLVIPPGRTGLSGPSERHAFRSLPPMPEGLTDRLCRLVLLELLPATVEADLAAFGAALSEIQAHIGAAFAPAQGGRPYADEALMALAKILEDEGLLGVGQSSWGPTLYGFSADDPGRRERLRDRVLERSALDPAAVLWTRPARTGTRFLEHALSEPSSDP